MGADPQGPAVLCDRATTGFPAEGDSGPFPGAARRLP